jgi:RNA polymerase sigma factor (sigma-70 family)
MHEPSQPASASEPELTTLHVRRAAAGDLESLGWVFERFSPLLSAQASYRLGPVVGARVEVEDVVAEAWLIALRKLGELVPREGRYTPVLLRYLASVVQNVANNRMRAFFRERLRKGPPEHDEQRFADELSASITGVVTRAGTRELALAIRAALDELDEGGRTLIILRGIEGRSNAEVAELLGEQPNTVSHRYRRALDRLRTALPRSVFDELVEP